MQFDTIREDEQPKAVPEWVHFLSAYSSTTGAVGEEAEEMVHLQVAYQMKLAEVNQTQPAVARMGDCLIEFGATSARQIPSTDAVLDALCNGHDDFTRASSTWSLIVCIAHSATGRRLLAMMRELCDVDETLSRMFQRDVLFSLSARSMANRKTTFVLTGYGDDALEQLCQGLATLA
ncbi:MAG: hypothetical protein V4671_05305 [Armatimonadota bacterium]